MRRERKITKFRLSPFSPGVVRARIDDFQAAPGSYTVTVAMMDSTGTAFLDNHVDAYPLKVTSTRTGDGMVYFPIRWDASKSGGAGHLDGAASGVREIQI
jgi:hypothetical protein